ncbi:MAG: cytochrome b N-terminal domain-containing protein [Gemmatimonadota bacterium]
MKPREQGNGGREARNLAEASPLAERLALEDLEYRIPKAANRLPYMLGGLTSLFVVVLILTGLYLAQFYNPSPVGAHDSVLYLIARAPLGDWVRSLHYWSAGAVVVTVVAHLVYVFWRRSYRRPREVTWWAGVGMAGLLFLLLVTGSALRYDQEGFEALAHFVAGGELTGLLGAFFTEGFTRSTTLLARIFSLHTSLLPILLVGLMALHFWLIRHLGIHADDSESSLFRVHATRLAGVGLLALAVVSALAVLWPEGLGYPPVAGAEVTKPMWPVLWVYGLENLLGAWGMVLGPAALFAFLAAVPLLDRGWDDRPGRHGWVGWVGLVLGIAVLGLWLFGVLGGVRQHIGM